VSRFGWICVILAAGLGFPLGQAAGQSAPPSEDLLPENTVGFLSVPDMEALETHWDKTQLGQLMADPIMEPFLDDLQRQFERRISGMRERLGLTIDDLEGVPGGEVALARILPGPEQVAEAAVVDVTGHLPQAKAMLEKLTANLLKQGAKRSTLKMSGTGMTVILLDIPKPADDPRGKARKAYYYLGDRLLLASDNADVIEGMLARLAGGRNDNLANVPAFQVVMQRCLKDVARPDYVPQIRWFLQPLGYAEATRAATPEQDRPRGRSSVDLMRNQGFEALRGLGGFVDFASEDSEIFHRTAVHAPPPYEKAMKMLAFPNREGYTPEPWVPRDVATYDTFYADVLKAFDNFGPLFDELFGEGESGVWPEVLESLRIDPNGPRIDLRADLVVHLGQRVSMFSDYKQPITPTSERLLFAIETTDPAKVAATIEKSMKNDPTAQRVEYQGSVIWEVIEEAAAKPRPRIQLHGLGGLEPFEDELEDEELLEERLLPHAAVTVANGHLLVASHIDFLRKVLDTQGGRDSLAQSIDYRRVDARLKQLAIPAKCARMFARLDEAFRVTYELTREGKMPESESLLGRLLNRMFVPEGEQGLRRQRVEGREMPDYDVVRRYLGPSGTAVTSEKDGWFIKGFVLNKP